MEKKDKVELKRRGFLSLMSVALFTPKISKAATQEISAIKIPSLDGKLTLPESPKPFQTIVELDGGRVQRLFSKRVVVPGKNKIMGKNGEVHLREIFERTQGAKIYLQYTGGDMGWIVLA